MAPKIILHIASAEKFIEPFIDLIEKNFNSNNHLFLVTENKVYQTSKRTNVVLISKNISRIKRTLKYIPLMNQADKIMLHGLFARKMLVLLFLQPWLLKKCYWVIWGGDLYYYQSRSKNFRADLFERIRAFVISRLGHFVTYIKGDFELAQKWYGAKGQYHECLMYPSNIYKEYDVPQKEHTTVNIQVGNSADPSNNHLEVFEKLLLYKEQDIKIFVPLSYGDQIYAKNIIEVGTRMFGDKFVPLTSFMPFEEYLEFLGQIDIALFAHKRQQGMGNTITLLGLGKKVYMRNDVTQWHLFEEIGVKVFDVEKLSLERLEDKDKGKNNELIREYFSMVNICRQWIEIFKGRKEC